MTTTVTNWTKTNRGPGRIPSPGQIIAAVSVGQTPPDLTISFAALMDVADLSDSTLLVTVGIEVSTDLGLTYTELATNNWQGGRVNRATGTWAVPGIIQFNNGPGEAPLDLRIIRAFAWLPKNLSFGGVLTIDSN